MTFDSNNSVLNSELAVDVMAVLASKEEGDYGSNLASKLDKPQASIGRILKSLHDIGFIKRGKREKAQYYVMDYDSVADYWCDTVREQIEEAPETIDKGLWLEEGTTSTDNLLEQFDETREQMKVLLKQYLNRVLTKHGDELDGITVSNLLFESFAYAIGHNLIQNKETASQFEHLDPMKDALVYFWNLHGFANELEDILKHYSE